jgi:hypothetical protein
MNNDMHHYGGHMNSGAAAAAPASLYAYPNGASFAAAPPSSNPYMQAYQQSSPPYANGGSGDNSYASVSAGSHPYGEDYMQQEEEWEREGLLDPLWEKQQRKVNTANRF